MQRFILLILSIMFISNYGFAKKSYYISGAVGSAELSKSEERYSVINYPENETYTKYDKSFVSDIKIGYDFSKLRIELEYINQEHEVKEMYFLNGSGPVANSSSGSGIKINSYFLNLHYDLDSIVIFEYITEPSIGIGIGSSNFNIIRETTDNDYKQNEDFDVSTWQSIISFNNQLSSKLSSIVSVQFINYNDAEITDTINKKLNVDLGRSSIISLGLRYNF